MASIWKSITTGKSHYHQTPHGSGHQWLLACLTNSLRPTVELIRYDEIRRRNTKDLHGASDQGRGFEPGLEKFWHRHLVAQIERPVPIRPPFAFMWLEANGESGCADATQIQCFSGIDNKPTVSFLFWVRRQNMLPYTIGGAYFQLNDDGTSDWNSFAPQRLPWQLEIPESLLIRGYLAQLIDTVDVLQFLHCKNIHLKRAESIGSSMQRNNLKGFSEWKTLFISSPTASRNLDAPAGEPSAERMTRFHVVRGHYADYRNGAGLFGNPNLKGIYWVAPHAKGNPDAGTIKKDYDIRTSE